MTLYDDSAFKSMYLVDLERLDFMCNFFRLLCRDNHGRKAPRGLRSPENLVAKAAAIIIVATGIDSVERATSIQLTMSKKVQFPSQEALLSVVDYVPSRTTLSQEDYKRLWYQRSDFQFSKSKARMISKESQSYGYSADLEGVYGGCLPSTQERLNLWCRYGHSRRGLERWANETHGQTRKREQSRAVKTVIFAQREMQKCGQSTEVEELRAISEALTQNAREFAQRMGQADEYAVALEQQLPNGSLRSALAQRRYINAKNASEEDSKLPGMRLSSLHSPTDLNAKYGEPGEASAPSPTKSDPMDVTS